MSEGQVTPAITLQSYFSPVENQWCPGCGNFGIVRAIKRALLELNLEPHQVLFVSGIGQAGKAPHYLKCNHLNELHGRALPAAIAAKIVNPPLTVIAEGGDGDGYGEGGNHFISAMARNVSITYLVHNNQVYGLTKGQASPTSDRGFVTKTTPAGAWDPLNPMALAIAANASFVARSYSADTEHLSNIIKKALQHKGFSLIDIFQPCVTYNHINTYQFYQTHLYKLEDDKSYDPSNRVAAFQKALEWGDKIPIGLFYQVDRPVFEENLKAASGVPLVKQKLDPMAFKKMLDEFA
ncbi:MAG: pyruvate ferredoxin/flavodoxin oxidoreductase, beta subunit [Chloroflexi bacterium]|nr:pyruvate ferredoxin/flavodoxin oxidoreductase, beta subunit [Chloroflexota bacterium]